MSIFSDILSIFVDKNFSKNSKNTKIKSFSLLEKYKEELDEIYFDDIFVATYYENIKNKLEQYKFFSDRSLVVEFSDLFCRIYVEQMSNFDKNDFYITSVPMHWSRYLIRWFDHMSNLAKYFCEKNNFNYIKILGVKFTKRQAKLNKKQRLKNRENVYFIKNFSKIPENIILLDDVVSTASSVNICAKKLKEIWVKKVFVFVLATNKK